MQGVVKLIGRRIPSIIHMGPTADYIVLAVHGSYAPQRTRHPLQKEREYEA